MKHYITLQEGGYYNEACRERGWIKSGQSCVIEYSQFQNFMNDNEVTTPIFVGDTYASCIKVANELNEEASKAKYSEESEG